MTEADILSHLARVGELLDFPGKVELLLVGGAAGILTKQLSPGRTTGDCDVIRYDPSRAEQAVLKASRQVASERKLPPGWL